MKLIIMSLILAITTRGLIAEEPHLKLKLWPGDPPGQTNAISSERDLTKPSDNLIAGRPVIRLGNVSDPTIELYQPSPDAGNGTAILVFPGGGYHILAMDLEGTEVCEWLNSIGITAVLLKYRVPHRTNVARYLAPLQDAQRAVGLVRQNSQAWRIRTNRVGVLGFSAGGHLAAALGCNFEQRVYSTIDAADQQSCRPDFSVLVYPGGLTLKDENDRLAPELTVSGSTPPTFVAITQDDGVRVENAIFYYLALKQANVPVELHVYPTGGHGYGLRRTKEAVTTWPDRVRDWMRASGLMD